MHVDFEDLANAYWRATLDAYDAGRQHVVARAAAQIAHWPAERYRADEPVTPSAAAGVAS